MALQGTVPFTEMMLAFPVVPFFSRSWAVTCERSFPRMKTHHLNLAFALALSALAAPKATAQAVLIQRNLPHIPTTTTRIMIRVVTWW